MNITKKSRKKLITNTSLLILLLLVLLPSVLSLGIAPARKIVTFQDQKQESLSYTIVNNEQRDITVMLDVQGPLKEYIELPTQPIRLQANEKTKKISLKLAHQIPDQPNQNKYGLIYSDIILQEVPPEFTGQTQITLTPSIASELILRVPYPDKYLESHLIIIPEKNNILFSIPVHNYGSLPLQNVTASIQIRDFQTNLIKRLTTQSTTLRVNDQQTLSAIWSPMFNGTNLAIVEVSYDDQNQIHQKIFDVGLPSFKLLELKTPQFSLGKINELLFFIHTDWNGQIENVHADIQILHQGNVIHQGSTIPFSIELGTNAIQYLWDTENLDDDIEEYDIHLTLHAKQQQFLLKTTLNTRQAQEPFTPSLLTYTSLAAVILLVIILILLIHIQLRKRKRNA